MLKDGEGISDGVKDGNGDLLVDVLEISEGMGLVFDIERIGEGFGDGFCLKIIEGDGLGIKDGKGKDFEAGFEIIEDTDNGLGDSLILGIREDKEEDEILGIIETGVCD